MSELTDDQLDGLFRKSAEEFDPPIDPAAWPDMKARLDTHDGNPSGGLLPVWTKLLRWGLPLLLLLLLTGGGWYAYYRTTQVATKTKEQPTKAISQATQPSIADKTQPNAGPLVGPNPTQTPIADSPGSTADAPKELAALAEPTAGTRKPDERLITSVNRGKRSVSAATVDATNRNAPAYRPKEEVNRATTSEFTTPPSAVNERVTRKRRTEHLGVGSLAIQKQNRISRKRKKIAFTETGYLLPSVGLDSKRPVRANQELGQITHSETTGGRLPLPAVEQTESVSLPTLTELRGRPARWPALSPLANRPVIAQPDTVARRVVPKTDPMRGLSVRFVVAPDLSSIGLKNFSRPGTNVGLLLEYRLASRWSVQAGVIQSTKVYRALPSEYTYHPGDWGGYVPPASVDGKCNMLDIPINLRYDILLRPQFAGGLMSRWFINGGVTSYIMEREDYVYNYDKYTHNQKPGIDTTSGGYGFSNLNFSVGYERALSRRLSWQVEPFIKAPLKGVGYFKTNLLSTGVFFSIRYKL